MSDLPNLFGLEVTAPSFGIAAGTKIAVVRGMPPGYGDLAVFRHPDGCFRLYQALDWHGDGTLTLEDGVGERRRCAMADIIGTVGGPIVDGRVVWAGHQNLEEGA